ncbi:MAG: Phosphotransferase enzyme family [Actinomycetota bacterium]|nr:Phosphotransferase enzyme family [Actinomycetota bacterium]
MMTCLSSAFNVEDVDIEEAIAEVASVVGERPRLVHTRAGQPWVGLTTDRAIHIAHDDRTRKRIREEAERLAWAARNGIPVPAVVESRTDWLITARAVDDGVTTGRGYVEAAIGAARALAAAPEPPPSLRAPVAAHGGGRKAGLVRLARIVRSPLPPGEFRAVRAEATGLRKNTLAHGDYVLHNILFDRSKNAVTVIDWEFLTRAPAHQDLLMLWPRLTEADDRALVIEEVERTTRDKKAAGVLHHWLAVRLLADLVTKVPPAQWDRPRIDATVARVAEAKTNRARWCKGP